jgi:hypothetical protein
MKEVNALAEIAIHHFTKQSSYVMLLWLVNGSNFIDLHLSIDSLRPLTENEKLTTAIPLRKQQIVIIVNLIPFANFGCC